MGKPTEKYYRETNEVKGDKEMTEQKQVEVRTVDQGMAELAQPFPADAIRWRVGRTNGTSYVMALAYIDARDVMNRLDAVLGAQNWQNDMQRVEGGWVCNLSVRIGNTWVRKTGVGSDTDVESVKGGASDAFKRAAVQWGVGRYLYELKDNMCFDVKVKDKNMKKAPEGYEYGKYQGKEFYWKPPKLPTSALPANTDSLKKSKPAKKASSKKAASKKENPSEKKEWYNLIVQKIKNRTDNGTDTTKIKDMKSFLGLPDDAKIAKELEGYTLTKLRDFDKYLETMTAV